MGRPTETDPFHVVGHHRSAACSGCYGGTASYPHWGARDGILEKEVYPDGQVGMRRQEGGRLVSIRGGALTPTYGMREMQWNDTYGTVSTNKVSSDEVQVIKRAVGDT